MFKISLIIFVILFIFSSTGCAHQEKLDSWIGNDIDDVITYWGVPDSTYETDDGRKIVKYSHSRIGGTTPTEYYCDVNFISDSSGKVIDAKAEGNIGGCNRLIKEKPSD